LCTPHFDSAIGKRRIPAGVSSVSSGIENMGHGHITADGPVR
jgi:hypothetical protein